MIEVTSLTKKFGDHLAVNDLSFRVEQGQIYGFLGPNGAGKSTTMNIMTGCLATTEGSVKMNGHDILEEPQEAKRQVGYLPELPPLYLDMTVKEYLKFVCGLKNIAKTNQTPEIQKVCERTGITDVENRLIKHLSKGYRQRVGLAQAILGDPEILILDEPTVGLDPKQIIEMRDLIKELGQKHTIILSSHILSEVDAICDKIMIISKGKLVACDTPDHLSKMMLGANHLSITVKGDKDQVETSLLAIAEITGCEIHPGSEPDTLEILLTCGQDQDVRQKVFFALAAIESPILSMHSAQMSLEDVFLELTEAAPSSPETPKIAKMPKVTETTETSETSTFETPKTLEPAEELPVKTKFGEEAPQDDSNF